MDRISQGRRRVPLRRVRMRRVPPETRKAADFPATGSHGGLPPKVGKNGGPPIGGPPAEFARGGKGDWGRGILKRSLQEEHLLVMRRG